MALEVATHKITCNCISPGYVWTPLVEKQIPDTMKARNLTREQVINDVLLDAQPTKEFVTSEQVAALALFLCGDDAAQITGTNLSIDGGWTAGKSTSTLLSCPAKARASSTPQRLGSSSVARLWILPTARSGSGDDSREPGGRFRSMGPGQRRDDRGRQVQLREHDLAGDHAQDAGQREAEHAVRARASRCSCR